MIAIIAAIDRNNAIGYENKLLFHVPNDMKRFKALTTGHTIIMGRKTFESLPKGVLPNRRNIVLSRNSEFHPQGAEVFPSLDEALKHCSQDEDIFIIGGASVYQQAMRLADRLYITEVEAAAPEADAFFPAIDKDVWAIENKECHPKDERHSYDYCFVDYTRETQTR